MCVRDTVTVRVRDTDRLSVRVRVHDIDKLNVRVRVRVCMCTDVY